MTDLFRPIFKPIQRGIFGVPPAPAIEIDATGLAATATFAAAPSGTATLGTTLLVGGQAIGITSASISGNVITYVLTNKIYRTADEGQSVSWVYDAGVGNLVVGGYYIGSQTVTAANNSTQVFAPTDTPGFLEYWSDQDTAKLYTTSALTTAVSANADPIGGWKGHANNYALIQPIAGQRLLYRTSGNHVEMDSSAATKNLSYSVSKSTGAALSVAVRNVQSTGLPPIYGWAVGNTVRTGISGISVVGDALGVYVALFSSATVAMAGTPRTGDRSFVVSCNPAGSSFALNDDGTLTTGETAIVTYAMDNIQFRRGVAASTVAYPKIMIAFDGAVSVLFARRNQVWMKAQP